MKEAKSIYISWLNDTLDMEYSLSRMLGEHIDKLLQENSELREKLVAQITRSEAHAELLGNIIVRRGGKIGKEGVLQEAAKAAVANFATAITSNDKIKFLLDERILEQNLIARYALLVAGARAIDELEDAVQLETILEDKKEGAVWFEEYIPEAVKKVLLEEG